MATALEVMEKENLQIIRVCGDSFVLSAGEHNGGNCGRILAGDLLSARLYLGTIGNHISGVLEPYTGDQSELPELLSRVKTVLPQGGFRVPSLA